MFNLEDWLMEDLKRLPEDRERLEASQNPLEREWLQRHIRDMDSLLDQLTELERELIQRLVINHEKVSVLVNETGYIAKELYGMRSDAIFKLLSLRFGAGYKP